MIQRNNNLSVLPFYRSIAEQSHRRSYAYGDVYPLYTPLGSVPPFQIIRQHNAATVADVFLHRVDGTFEDDVTGRMEESGLTVVQFSSDGYDIVVFPSRAPMNITPSVGQYYIILEMSDGMRYYSDVFTAVGAIDGYLSVQWYDMDDLVMEGSRIYYNGGLFRNQLWLATQLGKPDYTFEEEGEQRDGLFFPEKQISAKTYKFTFLASEYLCDVMRFIRMSDVVTVRDQFGNEYPCDTFLMTPKWEAQGNLASVEVEFTCDTVAKKIGHGWQNLGTLGDYNNDFNNDFDITNNN